MKVWKRNAVVIAIVLFVGAAVYLNWSYNDQSAADSGKQDGDGDKLLGQSSLVSGNSQEDMDGEQVSGADTVEQIGTGYFATARLNRQQARDNALELLRQAAADEKADPAAVEDANASRTRSRIYCQILSSALQVQ